MVSVCEKKNRPKSKMKKENYPARNIEVHELPS